MAAVAHMYNRTMATLGRGATTPRVYNKTCSSALVSEQYRAGAAGDSMTATAVYNKTSTFDGLIHHDDSNGLWSCITKPGTGSDRPMGREVTRLVRVLLTELA
jgi:hypothetical protein